MAFYRTKFLSASLAALGIISSAYAQESAEDLAKKLSNPIASLISVPFQGNYDGGYGPNDGSKYTINIQPVIPFTLNEIGTSFPAPFCQLSGKTTLLDPQEVNSELAT